jgi:dipeptidyl aminopeptidase/acylaminoacyl peptidase
MSADGPRPDWEQRFRVPTILFPSWSRHAPDRLVYASTESGRSQLHSWDRVSGTRTQITDEAVGVLGGHVTPDGRRVVWLSDMSGDESGRWVAAPFEGGAAAPLEGFPPGWDEGLALGRERTVAAISDDEGFEVWVSEHDEGGKASPARLLHRHPESVRLAGGSGIAAGSVEQAGLSADETLACLEHSEHGDLIHQSLRVIDARSGEVVGELRDKGLELAGFAWSPIPGDARIGIGHEREGERRPAIWDPQSGEVRELHLGLEGLVEPADWWPDGSALLLVQLVNGRHRLHRLELDTDALTPIPTEPGSISGARVRPDGAVWYRVQDGTRPARLLEVGTAEPLLKPGGPPAPAGRRFEDWAFANPDGQSVHGFLVRPDGAPPYPTVMLVHGGPTWVDMDRWAPDVQAYADAGFLVAMVNYRGSLGYGQEWRDTLIGNIGFPETEDVIAGHDDLVRRGLADPARSVIAGWSWGGYITLLMQGLHPERFVTGIAGVPVGDYAAQYPDLSPTLQAYDRALLGGTPAEVPDLMRERSPISYVDRVRAPILVLAGSNDSRCPIRQVMLYVDRLRARGHPHELYVYETGHSSFDLDERVRQRALVLDFLAERVPRIAPLPRVREIAAEVRGGAGYSAVGSST